MTQIKRSILEEMDSLMEEISSTTAERNRRAIVTAGEVEENINVNVGPRFLNLFSEQLYSSPNKAFEELVANSWDAGATAVHIGVPDELYSDDAAVWVLDNGESMDVKGLDDLWNVGKSPKTPGGVKHGRAQIGKFGIGKLATYILAHEITYLCKSKDGFIRAVTMDYRRIDEAADSTESMHIRPLELDIRKIDEDQIPDILSDLSAGEEIIDLINKGSAQTR